MERRNTWIGLAAASCLLLAGCGTPSGETGEIDRDASGFGDSEAGQPSSLFEMDFGGGEAEVTKNLPADAVDKVGDAVKSLKDKSPPDISE